MSKFKIKNELSELLTESLSDVFRLAKSKIKKSSESHKEVTLIEARFKEVERKKRNGIIDDNYHDRTLNGIRKDLQSIFNEIKEEDLVTSYLKKKSIKKVKEKDTDFEKRLKFFGLKENLKGAKGIEIYQKHYEKFLAEFEIVLKKYSELGALKFNLKKVDNARSIHIKMAKIMIIPCIDNEKRFLWINLDFDGKKNKKSISSLGVLQLDYSKEMELIWRDRENMEVILTNQELAEVTLREVFELIMEEEQN